MNISKREKILLLVAVYLLIIYLGFRFIYSPINAKLVSAQAENRTLEQQVQKAEQMEKEKQKSVASIDKDLEHYYQLDEKVPRDRQFVKVLDFLGTLAEDRGVELLSIAYADQDAKTGKTATTSQATDQNATVKGVSSMTFSISTHGRFYQLLEYLLAIEHSSRIISVESVTMSTGQKETAASGSGSSGTGSSNSNPQAEDPISKGETQMENSNSAGSRAASGQVELESNKYDLNNVQMNLQITTYFDTQSPALDEKL